MHAEGSTWAIRPVSGGFGTVEQRRTWMSEVRDIVEGEPLTPFQRVAVACDFVSLLTHVGDEGLGFINSDVTLYPHRSPQTEWVGFESIYHGADDGVAVGDARIYDEAAPIGVGACTALAQRRPPPASK